VQYASRVMRNIVVDSVRRRYAARHGGCAERVEFIDELPAPAVRAEQEILLVHGALDRLATVDSRLAHIVEMRYFAGMTEAETAGALGLTERTVRREWQKARILLAQAMA
jgi:RNA polymerase sigma factor (TIGR02999 family)